MFYDPSSVVLVRTYLFFQEGEGGDSVGVELPAEEAVREEDLADHVDQVEDLGAEDPVAPHPVRPARLYQVGGQLLLLAHALLVVHHPPVQPGEDELEKKCINT